MVIQFFHVKGTLSTGTLLDVATTSITAGVGGVTGATAGLTIELVKALEDHITGFSGQSLANSDYVTGVNDPYSRDQGESTLDNIMNLTLFNKSVEARTFQVAAVTREQVSDLKQFGVDAVSQVEAVLINELTQDINKNILGRMFALGEKNHAAVIRTQGTNFLTWSTQFLRVVIQLHLAYIGTAALKGATMNATEVVNSASENMHSRQRKIMSKLLAIANLISIRGRGPATFVVTNGQVCSALQDVAGFIAAPMAMNQMDHFPVGT